MTQNQSPDLIVFDDVSKFYGEVLGVNRVRLEIPPGITSLVGPSGSGKTTLLNLLTGLLRPSKGRISVLGKPPSDSEGLLGRVGYCSQFDAFPRGLTGYRFLYGFLCLHGLSAQEADQRTWEALQKVGLVEAGTRKVAAYSKGMRQRIKLALAIAHHPRILVLDEPLNGLDPMARAEVMDLFQSLARHGSHIIISSHILHEVDMISDQVILLDQGYVVAQGEIRGVRREVKEQPLQVLIRCDRPGLIAAEMFRQDHVVEARISDDQRGLLIRTLDADRLYSLLGRVVLEQNLTIERVAPADEDVQSVYNYLIGRDGESR